MKLISKQIEQLVVLECIELNLEKVLQSALYRPYKLLMQVRLSIDSIACIDAGTLMHFVSDKCVIMYS